MKKIIDGKLLAVCFIVTNLIYVVMLLWSLPKLVEYSEGLRIFDMRPAGYTFLEAMKLLNSLGTAGLDFYKNVQLRLDLFYPLGFMLTYAIGCLWIYKRIDRWIIIGKVGAIASIITGISDYVENFYIYKILSVYPDVSKKLVFYANGATLTKSMASIVAMSIFMLSFLVLGIIVLKRKFIK